jgi:hypothetical protein
VASRMRLERCMTHRLEIGVTFDERRGYVTTSTELPTITALSLNILRRRVEERLIEDVDVRLVFDRAARLERDRRRQQATLMARAR